MIEYYPSLVEAAIEFKILSRKIIAKFKGKIKEDFFKLDVTLGEKYNILPEHETIDCSD